MPTIAELQERIKNVFGETFGDVPLRIRLQDIANRPNDLLHASTRNVLKEKAGDLLCSLIQLFSEMDFDLNESVEVTLAKIQRRTGQYRSLARRKRVAILIGAFDPITIGHVKTVQYVLDVTGDAFDEGWLMPDFRHLDKTCLGDPEHRVRACHIAVRNDGRIRVSDYQIQKQMNGETYALVKSLLAEKFAKEYSFYFIMGTDNANKCHTFVNWVELERLVPFVVVPRKGFDADPAVIWYKTTPHIDLTMCERTIPNTQSSEVRRIFRERLNQDNLKELLDGEVLKFLKSVRAYKQPRM